MKIKTSELNYSQLSYTVTKIEHPELVWGDSIGVHWASNQVVVPVWDEPKCYSPYMSWEMCGLIIERENISLIRCDDDYKTESKGFTTRERVAVWAAEHGAGHSSNESFGPQGDNWGSNYSIGEDDCSHGTTPLIAAMRCYVKSKLGNEVEIPEELL